MSEEKEVQSLFSEIEKRCRNAGRKIEIGKKFVKIYFPIQAKEMKVLALIPTQREAEDLMQVSFEKFQMLNNYEAIWSEELQIIEARLTSSRSGLGDYRLQRYIQYQSSGLSDLDGSSRLLITADNDKFEGIKVSIGFATKTFKAIGSAVSNETVIGTEDWLYRRKREFELDTVDRGVLTITIQGVKPKGHGQAQRILENIANPILIQLDDLGISLRLANEEYRRRKRRPSLGKELPLKLSEFQFEPEPVSLYWYANEAEEMPLLQYLAYYQVIEFFFIRYAEKQTTDIVKRMLKNPSFEIKMDENINRLIVAIRPYVGKGKYPEERASLKATLEYCLSSEEIKDFIESNEEIKAFFKNKDDWQTIASQNLLEENSKTGQTILSSTALRIYQIRCRIVHTKSADTDNQVEPLLPFSKEIQKLYCDIQLIKFVAKSVLLASGQTLSLR